MYIKWLNKAIFTEKTDYNLTLRPIIKQPIKRRSKSVLFIGVFLVFLALVVYPYTVNASWFSLIFGPSADASGTSSSATPNSQTLTLLKAAVNVDPNPAKDNQIPVIIGDSIVPPVDPMGNSTSSVNVFDSSEITTYVVRSGDTLPQIAKTFGITANTIMIANNMTSSKLTEGQHLIILPVSGVQHTIKSGETLGGIAKTYKVAVQDIMQYNYFENASDLAVGDQIFIPSDVAPSKTQSKTSGNVTKPTGTSGTGSPLCSLCRLDASSVQGLINDVGYFIEPLLTYHKTQGLHGHNAIDLGAPIGTPIVAAAAGEVIVSRMGWNGGYGNYVVIQHNNGTQTVYGHASKLLVTEGQEVTQGQTIALVGTSGDSTGPHLHVEVRGGKNPF